MPEYAYQCPSHGPFSIMQRMDDQHTRAPCPECHTISDRMYTSLPTHFHTSGFHGRRGHYVGDYDSRGDKLEQLNAGWSKAWGEPPPPPAKTVPKNSGEKY
jgi:putative FmdB family regulatory protein